MVSGSRGASETVVITHITFAIAISIFLTFIGNQRAVVSSIRNAITIGVSGITAATVADITNTIAVGIGLVCIGRKRTVISVIRYTISVSVIVADVTDSI